MDQALEKLKDEGCEITKPGEDAIEPNPDALLYFDKVSEGNPCKVCGFDSGCKAKVEE